uniref:Non-structural maintenance of chromosomes element 4 n=1 Tax=Kalanchoe fedtschenkoi TaxID=63787 RepID=A0A7N0TH71_KALFE
MTMGSRAHQTGDDVAECSVKQERLNNNSTQPLDSNCNGAVDRRLLRSHYLALKTLIHDQKHEADDMDAFTSVITKVDNLHHLVQKPREQVADAEALLDISNNLVTSVKSRANEGLTPSDFVARLVTEYGLYNGTASDAEQISLRWHDLGCATGHIFRNCRGCCTMLGPLTNELKQRKVAAQRQRSNPTDTCQPETLYDKREEEQTDTDKNMLTMFGILRRRKRVLLESLILNRNSFAQTVENLFALSFLVKDGRVEILVDEKGSHFVCDTQECPLSQSSVFWGC